MKLTQDQITTITAALRDYEDKAQSRSEVFTDSTYWAENAETARTLLTLFEDALSVEVESVRLEPAKDACGDIGCDGQCPVNLVAEHGQADLADIRVIHNGQLVRPPLASVPPLLNAIDACTSGQAARDVLRNAEPAERRAVAKFLGIPVNDLLDVITRRLRPALQAAA